MIKPTLEANCLHLCATSSCTKLKHMATTTKPTNRYRQQAKSCIWALKSGFWGNLSPRPIVVKAMKQKYAASKKVHPLAEANPTAPRHMYPTKMIRAIDAGTGGDDVDDGVGEHGLGDLLLVSCVRHISGTLDGVSCDAQTLKII